MRDLALGRADESIKRSRSVDPWLSCHLTDIFIRMGILSEGDEAPEGEALDQDEENTRPFHRLSSYLRSEAIESYASYLLEDQGLWRIALDYLSQNRTDRNQDSGADDGSSRARRAMRAVIMKVPVLGTTKGKARQLDDARVGGDEEVMNSAEGQGETDEFETADELIEACDLFGLEKEKRLICKVSSLSPWAIFRSVDGANFSLMISCARIHSVHVFPSLTTETSTRTFVSSAILTVSNLCDPSFGPEPDSADI